MKKLILTSLLASALVINVSAQWVPGTGIITTTNKVGLGTSTAPLTYLDLITSTDAAGATNRMVSNFLKREATDLGGSAIYQFGYNNGGIGQLELNCGTSGSASTLQYGTSWKDFNIVNNVMQATPVVTVGNINFVTNGVARMKIASTGNVGIGSTTPFNLLSIKGSTSTGGIEFGQVDVNGVISFYPSATISLPTSALYGTQALTVLNGPSTIGNIKLNINNINKLLVTSTGVNVFGTLLTAGAAYSTTLGVATDAGIGTMAPKARLHVVGPKSIFENSATDGANVYLSASSAPVGQKNWCLTATNTGNFNVSQANDTYVLTKTVLTANAVGNVGVGTETPQAKLDVAGNLNVLEQININPTSDGKLSTVRFNNWRPGNAGGGSNGFSIVSQQNIAGEEDGLKFMNNSFNPVGDRPIEMLKISTGGNLAVAGKVSANEEMIINPTGDGERSTLTFKNFTPGRNTLGLDNVGWSIISEEMDDEVLQPSLKFNYNRMVPGNTITNGEIFKLTPMGVNFSKIANNLNVEGESDNNGVGPSITIMSSPEIGLHKK
jgi:hypothetical protein